MSHDEASVKPVVLVVEDEPLLCMQAVGLVEEAGFEAIVSTNADEAIEILMARTDIRIVFTDIGMPGSMDGLKLAAAVRDRWPPIEIIVTCDKIRPTVEMLPARGYFFAKPYNERLVIQALHRMVA